MHAGKPSVAEPEPVHTPYKLGDLDPSDCHAMAELCQEILDSALPPNHNLRAKPWFDLTAQLFRGCYPGYQAADTCYHDLEHTLLATVCCLRILAGRRLHGVSPIHGEASFKAALIAILLHDTGYLKEAGDDEGTGAKYTFVHESRSCVVAQRCLPPLGLDVPTVQAICRLIRCTGPRARIEAISFRNEGERLLGLAVCTADYLGQMSDPNYVGKLVPLFWEFEESDNYRNVPPEHRPYRSASEMIRRTPAFWQETVLPKLTHTCAGLYRFLEDPSGANPYLEQIEQNLAAIPLHLARVSA